MGKSLNKLRKEFDGMWFPIEVEPNVLEETLLQNKKRVWQFIEKAFKEGKRGGDKNVRS